MWCEMTEIKCVTDLIAALKDMPPEAPVFSWVGFPITEVELRDEGVVLVEDGE